MCDKCIFCYYCLLLIFSREKNHFISKGIANIFSILLNKTTNVHFYLNICLNTHQYFKFRFGKIT